MISWRHLIQCRAFSASGEFVFSLQLRVHWRKSSAIVFHLPGRTESVVQRWRAARPAPSTTSTQTTPERQQAQRSARTLPGSRGPLQWARAGRSAARPGLQHGGELRSVSCDEMKNLSSLLQKQILCICLFLFFSCLAKCSLHSTIWRVLNAPNCFGITAAVIQY